MISCFSSGSHFACPFIQRPVDFILRFSRHGSGLANPPLLIWLIGNVGFLPCQSESHALLSKSQRVLLYNSRAQLRACVRGACCCLKARTKMMPSTCCRYNMLWTASDCLTNRVVSFLLSAYPFLLLGCCPVLPSCPVLLNCRLPSPLCCSSLSPFFAPVSRGRHRYSQSITLLRMAQLIVHTICRIVEHVPKALLIGEGEISRGCDNRLG